MQRRAYGEQAVRAGCVLAALTGNVGIPGGWASGMALQGRTLRMKVAPDGELVVLDDASGQTAATIATLAALVDRVPAALPSQPVRAHEKWTRHMVLAGAPGDGIDAEFTLDSLTRYGDFAWVSVKGVMKDAGADAGASVVGWVLLDRRRGWITRSRMVMTMRAVTGVPIKFLGAGEKPAALEAFEPDCSSCSRMYCRKQSSLEAWLGSAIRSTWPDC
jgi:hypothetical protein